MKYKGKTRLLGDIDWMIITIPLLGVVLLSAIFMLFPERSSATLNKLRLFLGNQMGSYYILTGLGIFVCSLYIAFSKYGNIRMGKSDRPKYSNFAWGTMIFTSTMAADILYWSLIEWAYYVNELYVKSMGVQKWAPTFPIFHWGPIPWGFYIVLAVAFGFMLHVRGRS